MEVTMSFLINNLKQSFDGKPWFGDSVMNKLNAVNWKQANKSVSQNGNTIAKLIKHMNNWKQFVIINLQGYHDYFIELNGPVDWPEVDIKNEAEWKDLLRELKDSHSLLIEVLSTKSDEILDNPTAGHNRTYRYSELINGIAQHDIYHLGQIVLISKA